MSSDQQELNKPSLIEGRTEAELVIYNYFFLGKG